MPTISGIFFRYLVISGILEHCDDAMNVEMKDVTIHESKHHTMPLHYDSFYIKGKFIRFVHFDHYFNASKVVHKWLNVPQNLERSSKKRTR